MSRPQAAKAYPVIIASYVSGMTNLQFLALLIPSIGSLILVVLAWLHQNTRLADLKADVRQFQSDVNKRLDTIDNHLMNFYNVSGKLEGRIEELSRR